MFSFPLSPECVPETPTDPSLAELGAFNHIDRGSGSADGLGEALGVGVGVGAARTSKIAVAFEGE